MGRPRTAANSRPLSAAEQRERFDALDRRLDRLEAALSSRDKNLADSLAHLVGRLLAYEVATGRVADAAEARGQHADLVEAQLLEVTRELVAAIRKVPALVAHAVAALEPDDPPKIWIVPRDGGEAA